jgi:spore coat polysaccharide biosynthesis predicted glycosyltransferase SpsG
MSKSPAGTIALICDADHKIGYGHHSRCQTLHNHLLQHQALQDKLVHDKLVHDKLLHKKLSLLVHYQTDTIANITKFDQLNLQQLSLALIDTPYADNRLIKQLKDANIPIICLDLFPEQPVDLVIALFEHQATDHADLLGLDYCIIRDQIRHCEPQQPVRSASSVLITIGGADINNLSQQVIEQIKQYPLTISVVLGPLADPQSTSKLLKDNSVNVYQQPDNFAALLNSHDWVISNAGTTLFEAMYLGKAVNVIPQTEHEANVAQYALEQQAILGIGIEQLAMPSEEQMKVASSNARQLVDGKGVERIVELIVERIVKQVDRQLT